VRGGTRRSSYRRSSYRRSGERYVSDYDRQEKRKAETERTQTRLGVVGAGRIAGERRDERAVHDTGRVEGRVEEGPRSARDQERGGEGRRDDGPTHAEAQEWAWKQHRRNFDDLSRDDRQVFYNEHGGSR